MRQGMGKSNLTCMSSKWISRSRQVCFEFLYFDSDSTESPIDDKLRFLSSRSTFISSQVVVLKLGRLS